MKQIQLEQWITTKDSKGNNTESISNTYSIWAEVSFLNEDRSGLNQKKQIGLTNMLQFRIWFNDNLTVTGNWRLNYDGKKFTVHSIEKENQNNFFWIIKAESIGPR